MSDVVKSHLKFKTEYGYRLTGLIETSINNCSCASKHVLKVDANEVFSYIMNMYHY